MSVDLKRIDVAGLRQRLKERSPISASVEGFQPAAVLAPLVVEPGLPDRLLFTVRNGELRTHAGQISFPGGKREANDADSVATALREAAEELGLPDSAAEPLGVLDEVPTPSGFLITPVVGLLRGPLTLYPSAHEVAAVFACSLEELAHPSRYVDGGTRTFRGIEYTMHEYHWQEHRIWGATARVVHQLLQIIGA